MTRTWIVEIDVGAINWQPICYCFSEKQAEDRAALHEDASKVRVREYGDPAPVNNPKK